MEGRYPNGLLLALTNCNDSSKEDEFNTWYNDIHIPDVAATGVFQEAIRFVSTSPKRGEAKHIATYETTWEDVSKALAALKEGMAKTQTPDRLSPLLEVVRPSVAYKKLDEEFCTTSKPTRGILMVMLNCEDPAKEQEFNKWYADVHIPDILSTGAFHTAYRYESLDPDTSNGKYLAIYETDYSDPSKAGDELIKQRPDWEQRGRLLSGTELVLRATARRIWPMD